MVFQRFIKIRSSFHTSKRTLVCYSASDTWNKKRNRRANVNLSTQSDLYQIFNMFRTNYVCTCYHWFLSYLFLNIKFFLLVFFFCFCLLFFCFLFAFSFVFLVCFCLGDFSREEWFCISLCSTEQPYTSNMRTFSIHYWELKTLINFIIKPRLTTLNLF